MWIRSQDKNVLINVELVQVIEYDLEILGHSGARVGCIGKYSTKEKALKVLDMIQEFINCIEEYKAQGEYKREIVSGCNEIRRLNTFVFQMPQDSEVE